MVGSFVVPFVARNPLWMITLLNIGATVLLPFGEVATRRFASSIYRWKVRQAYWAIAVAVVICWIELLYMATRYWPEFLRELGFL